MLRIQITGRKKDFLEVRVLEYLFYIVVIKIFLVRIFHKIGDLLSQQPAYTLKIGQIETTFPKFVI